MAATHDIRQAGSLMDKGEFEEIFGRIGYVLASLKDHEIQAIVDLIEALADDCQSPGQNQAAATANAPGFGLDRCSFCRRPNLRTVGKS